MNMTWNFREPGRPSRKIDSVIYLQRSYTIQWRQGRTQMDVEAAEQLPLPPPPPPPPTRKFNLLLLQCYYTLVNQMALIIL